MSQDAAALWERVLERYPELKEALSSNRVVESSDDDVDPFADDTDPLLISTLSLTMGSRTCRSICRFRH